VTALIAPSPRLSLTVTPTHADLGHLARAATRRLRLTLGIFGLLMWLIGLLALADGDLMAFVSGALAMLLGIGFYSSAFLLPRRLVRRMPRSLSESRTCEIDDEGIRFRGSNWANEYTWAAFRKAVLAKHLVLLHREPGAQGVALPRSAFTPEQEAQLVAILTAQKLMPGTR
jgi:hypothetical protein